MLDKIGKCIGVHESFPPQNRQEISTKHTNYELLMDHIGIKTYERKKLERKQEESAAAAIDRTHSAETIFNGDAEDLSSNEMEERAADQNKGGPGKKKGHRIAYEQFSTTDLVSILIILQFFYVIEQG